MAGTRDAGSTSGKIRSILENIPGAGIVPGTLQAGPVRGAREPVFEYDFPPGMDMMTEIREGPLAQERLELELACRLREVC